METLIGKGVLSWPSFERRSDRYGTIMLMKEGSNSAIVYEPIELINKPKSGKKVRLFVIITETRESTHIGDLFRGISPTIPKIGEKIVLGEGFLFYGNCNEYITIGVRPLYERSSFIMHMNNL